MGGGGVPGQERDPDARKFVIEFAGGQLDALPADAPVEGMFSASAGELTGPVVQKNVVTGSWRAFFDYHPDGADPVELVGQLKLGDEALTELWSYQWAGE